MEMLILKTLLSVVGVFLFLYFFWKKLKDDYTQNLIFPSAIYCLIGILIAGFGSFYFFPRWFFWISVAGSLLGLLVSLKRFNMRVFEVYEGWVLGSLGLFLVFSMNLFINGWNEVYLLGVILAVFLISLYFLVDRHYKKFAWYKSGKVGFTGLSISGVTFLIFTLIAIFFPDMVFFQGKIGASIAGTLSFISFILLFNLSQKSV